MNRIAELFRENRRLAILRFLSQTPDYAASDDVLCQALESVTLMAGYDTVRADLVWLDEQGLLETNEIADIMTARINKRGVDVAAGRSRVPGVKRPGP
jgi:Fe2+ or Zn2+ uptake regulation protein